jgi:hypothetical protein
MGIIRIAIDLAIISTGAAGVRRLTGLSLQNFLLQKITNQFAVKMVTGYFDFGEKVLNKATGLYSNYITSPEKVTPEKVTSEKVTSQKKD